MSLSVVILAAGQGKRMVSRLPKVLHRVGGMTLIDRVINTARALEPETICVVYGHGGEQVPRAIDAPDVQFVRQAPQLGTGDALRAALPSIDESDVTLVLYGDVPLVRPETLSQMVAARGEQVTVLTATVDDPAGYGRVVRDSADRIRGIVEDADATPAQKRIREINTGIMALPTARLASWLGRLVTRNAQSEYYLTDIVALARSDGVQVKARLAGDSEEVLGANNPVQLAQLERAYQRRCARQLLEQGVFLADPARIDVRGELRCAKDVSIDVNCVFQGTVSLDAQVSIGPNCVLKNVVVGARTVVEPYTLIENAVIGADCRIGPFARIRPGARLARAVHVGNFVEVKNSAIGAQSKANHLAYIGDATVGARVNIGAGTITCNYDGVNKHRTVIEDDVQIGSDVQLVAPVTVGKGATVGAGTTVWKHAPAGVLTVNEKTQVSLPKWKRPRKKRT
jgi:bifunctional UDP-N-acetylglucosamine pyrophosphorylase/glucosamine-1-phosphate N-acetyltransferase